MIILSIMIVVTIRTIATVIITIVLTIKMIAAVTRAIVLVIKVTAAVTRAIVLTIKSDSKNNNSSNKSDSGSKGDYKDNNLLATGSNLVPEKYINTSKVSVYKIKNIY